MKTRHVTRKGKRILVVLAEILCIPLLITFFTALPVVGVEASEDFFDLSLSELLNTEVTSVSKTSEKRQDAAAAIYVITQDDIERSSANSIPDLLRTVPGISVAQIDSNKWSITSRGFGGHFASKLLVLIDGRSVYTPYFSGVYWEIRDVMLEDVDRIEIIRGPGGALWGANAVNGVINIVTKKASDTQGGLLSAGLGTEEKAFSSIRYGWSNEDEDTFYRLYAKFNSRDSEEDIVGSGQGHDDWLYGRLGFRIDKTLSNSDEITIQGDYFDLDADTAYTLLDFGTLTSSVVNDSTKSKGGNLTGRWTRKISDDSTIQLQGFWDYYELGDIVHGEKLHTWDIEFQHSFNSNGRHQLVWGFGYRGTVSDHENSVYSTVSPSATTKHIFNVFAQDQIALTDELKLTLGVKVEHNDYTGIEVQPSARLAWLAKEDLTLWGSISRAVRTPSEAENNLSPLTFVTGGTTPFFVYGDNSTRSEELMSYEAGIRYAVTSKVALDVAAFYNDYQHLRSVTPNLTVVPPIPGAAALSINNEGDSEVYGFEAVVDWKVTNKWTQQYVYSYAHFDHDVDVIIQDKNTPEQQFSLKNYILLTESLELDATIRYVDQLSDIGIDDYVTGDIRLAWKPKEDLSIELVGRDLFGPSRLEFDELIAPFVHTEVERGIYGKITWKF
jgi:iron complex outermembrane receptor protein